MSRWLTWSLLLLPSGSLNAFRIQFNPTGSTLVPFHRLALVAPTRGLAVDSRCFVVNAGGIISSRACRICCSTGSSAKGDVGREDKLDLKSKSKEAMTAFRRFPIKYVVLSLLVIQNSATTLMVKYTRTPRPDNGPMYLGTMAVLLSELLKLPTCLALIAREEGSIKGMVHALYRGVFQRWKDSLRIAIPALCYGVQVITPSVSFCLMRLCSHIACSPLVGLGRMCFTLSRCPTSLPAPTSSGRNRRRSSLPSSSCGCFTWRSGHGSGSRSHCSQQESG